MFSTLFKCFVTFLLTCNCLTNVRSLETKEAVAFGANVNYTKVSIEAYQYAYPLVMEAATELMFLLTTPGMTTNKFFHKRAFPETDDKSVVRPNQDTLYSTAFLDLSEGPLEMSIPATKTEQYYLFQIMDAWTNVFANPGSRTTGHSAQKHLIVGPKGVPPKTDVSKYTSVIKSPTSLVWIIVRTLVRNDNFDEVHKIQDQYLLKSLNTKTTNLKLKPNQESVTNFLLSFLDSNQCKEFGGKTEISKLISVNMENVKKARKTSTSSSSSDLTVPELVEKMTGNQFFTVASILMCRNPPLRPQDNPALKKFEAIGFKPCRGFKTPNAAASTAVKNAPVIVYKGFRSSGSSGDTYNGWNMVVSGLGTYGTNYPLRAAIAYSAIGANLPEDAVYPSTCIDAAGKLLDGKKAYTMTFKKGSLPPVGAFWSVTMYDSDWFLFSNPSAPIDRQRVSSASTSPALTPNSDGSLTLFFQPNAPSLQSNWIPTREDIPFCLTLRLYAPGDEILSLKWVPPYVELN